MALKRAVTLALSLAAIGAGCVVVAAPAFAAAPTITSFTPASGPLGSSVTITGTGFLTPATVSFDGVAASTATVLSTTKIVTAVPSTADTGRIRVTDSGGTVVSAGIFTVTPGLTLSPTAGPPGTMTTAQFSGFSAFEAVDVYVDTTDVALISASSTGAASTPVTVPASASPGSHWITAVGRHSGYSAQASFLVRANWLQEGYSPGHRNVSPFENQLSTSTAPNLNQAWRSASPQPGIVSSPAVSAGIVYEGFPDGTLKAFTESTGAVRWQRRTGAPVQSSPAVSGSTVYIGSDDGFLYALSATTGAIKWRTATGGPIRSSPTVVDGVVYVGSFDFSVYAINAVTGAIKWSYSTGEGVFSSPAVVGGVVYVGSEDNNVYALDATKGTLDWSFATGSNVDASPVVVNGRVYVGSLDKSIYALRASSGQVVWTYATGAVVYGTAAVVNGIVYVGSGDGYEYALRTGTGALVWSNQASGNSLLTSTTYANGVVYVGDTQHTFELAAGSGGVLGTIDASGSFGAAVVVDGSVFVGDYFDGVLIRFALDQNAQAAAAARPAPASLRPLSGLRSTRR